MSNDGNHNPKEETAKVIAYWSQHERDSINLRTDWFLIFHAILFEAYLSARPSNLPVPGDAIPINAIAMFGLLTSAIWFFVGVRNEWQIRLFAECLQDKSIVPSELARVMSEIRHVRKHEEPRWMRWAHAVPLFGKTIPLACFGVWTAFGVSLWGLSITLLMCGITIGAMGILQLPRTKIPPQVIHRFRPTGGSGPLASR